MNENLSQFLMFYSQSDAGNGLTRGLEHDLAKKTYVKTKLDRELASAVLSGELKLVILTGNAGDGKTAFIQTLEHEAEDKGAKFQSRDEVGSQFELNGFNFKTLYDGSIELESQSNSEMLTEFFTELKGDVEPNTNACLVVAMNEGKLTDFFTHSEDFGWLGPRILDHLIADSELPDQIAIVNLNLRSIVDAYFHQTNSLFDLILDRYVASEFWEPCESCPAKHRCPVLFNVNTFRFRSTSGQSDKEKSTTQKRNEAAHAARSRLKSIFQMLHFRKRIHVTVRDLRSILAYTLFGKKDCPEIIGAVEDGDAEFQDAFYYNAVFDENEKDRIIELVKQFDIGKASSPMTDARLSFMRPNSQEFRNLFLSFDRSQSDIEELRGQYENKPKRPEDRTLETLETARQYVLSLRRKLYFEDAREEANDRISADLIPYQSIRDFLEFIKTGEDQCDRIKSSIILAISRSEKIYNEELGSNNICIQTRHDDSLSVRAFFTYPADQFVLEQEPMPDQAKFIEFLPSMIVLRHVDRPIRLEISLDLYEVLMRIRNGYVPAAKEMKSFFLNLLMFKKQLMSTPSPQLLLSGDDFETYQLSRTPENKITIARNQ